ncbi:PH domain-containing protein [Streptomyces sp. NPDC047968]|uniref:PH domain-containing protein n=1 Tax=unclassified Streptomyces TaxID=2593676 RepID=UPI003418CAF7
MPGAGQHPPPAAAPDGRRSPAGLPREYRAGAGRTAPVVVAAVLAAVGAGLPVWAAPDVAGWVQWLVALVLGGLCAWFAAGAARAATVADADGLRVRGFLRVSRLPWSEVQDIRTEANPAAGTQRRAPLRVSHAYGPRGRRVALRYVDDARVDLDREIAFLRRVWQERRGDTWTPEAGVARRIAHGESLRSAVAVGVASAMLSFVPLAVLMLLPLFGAVPAPVAGVLTPWAVMGLGVPAAFGTGAALSYRRARRAGGRGL